MTIVSLLARILKSVDNFRDAFITEVTRRKSIDAGVEKTAVLTASKSR